jgi:hypothetical protein
VNDYEYHHPEQHQTRSIIDFRIVPEALPDGPLLLPDKQYDFPEAFFQLHLIWFS